MFTNKLPVFKLSAHCLYQYVNKISKRTMEKQT